MSDAISFSECYKILFFKWSFVYCNSNLILSFRIGASPKCYIPNAQLNHNQVDARLAYRQHEVRYIILRGSEPWNYLILTGGLFVLFSTWRSFIFWFCSRIFSLGSSVMWLRGIFINYQQVCHREPRLFVTGVMDDVVFSYILGLFGYDEKSWTSMYTVKQYVYFIQQLY